MLKLKYNSLLIEDYNSSVFKKRKTRNKLGEIEEWEEYYGENSSNPYPGLNYMKIVYKKGLQGNEPKNKLKNNVTMKISSKILGEDYMEMINKNNFHKVIEKINKTGIIRISQEDFLEEAQVISCHVTCNLRMNAEIHKYIKSLYRLAIANHRNKIHAYPGKESNKLSGLTLCTRTKKNNRRRILFYDKYNEIMSEENKYSFLSKKHKEQFKNILRIEISLNKFKHIRKYLNIQKSVITLKDVLNSDANPISKQLREFMRLRNFENLYEETDEIKTVNERNKEERREKVLNIYRQNMGTINNLLRITNSNPSYKRAKYLKTYRRIYRDELKMGLKDFMLIRGKILK
ncbi:MAG: hypothetical protein HF312_00285 [Ignavibacteria bacterium]|jgi:hypothetical protein|nr:hypothetical protein [Ignavibacteria bacterium]MCU7518619.1 hypothetical protein [Ignavibacteria bacterium]